MQGAGCRVQGAEFRVQGSGCRGSGCRVQGSGCRVQGSGCGESTSGALPQRHHPRPVAWEQVRTLRVVHLGRSPCHATSGRGGSLNRSGLLSFHTFDVQVGWEIFLKFKGVGFQV